MSSRTLGPPHPCLLEALDATLSLFADVCPLLMGFVASSGLAELFALYWNDCESLTRQNLCENNRKEFSKLKESKYIHALLCLYVPVRACWGGLIPT